MPTLWGRYYYYLHFADEKLRHKEKQSLDPRMKELGLKPRQFESRMGLSVYIVSSPRDRKLATIRKHVSSLLSLPKLRHRAIYVYSHCQGWSFEPLSRPGDESCFGLCGWPHWGSVSPPVDQKPTCSLLAIAGKTCVRPQADLVWFLHSRVLSDALNFRWKTHSWLYSLLSLIAQNQPEAQKSSLLCMLLPGAGSRQGRAEVKEKPFPAPAGIQSRGCSCPWLIHSFICSAASSQIQSKLMVDAHNQ